LKLGLDGQWMMPYEKQKTRWKDDDISIGFKHSLNEKGLNLPLVLIFIIVL
jgi:hypothetical protein